LLLRSSVSPVRRSASPAPLRTSTVFLGSYSLACLRVCFLACLPACLLCCVCVCSDISHRCSNTSARCTRLGPFAAVFRRSGPRPLWSSATPVLGHSGPRSLRSSAAAVLRRSGPRSLQSSRSPQVLQSSAVLSLFGAWYRLDSSIVSALGVPGALPPVPGWTRLVVVRPLRRSAARLSCFVLRASTGARSSRALRHNQFGARFVLRSAISALHPLMRSAALLGRSLSCAQLPDYSKLCGSATAISALDRLGARLSPLMLGWFKSKKRRPLALGARLPGGWPLGTQLSLHLATGTRRSALGCVGAQPSQRLATDARPLGV